MEYTEERDHSQCTIFRSQKLSNILEWPRIVSEDDHSQEPSLVLVKNGTKKSKYKTELCRSWEERGTCEYGKDCLFAHGVSELRQMERHPLYKTELCKTFHETGTCSYGVRCKFRHQIQREKKRIKSKKRLPVFDEITS